MILQLTLYDRMPEHAFKEYFEVIDKYYLPLMAEAPGLISMQRFSHWDLPEKVMIELWETKEQELAWDNSEAAQKAWREAMGKLTVSVPHEYKEGRHSVQHRHYRLEKSFKPEKV